MRVKVKKINVMLVLLFMVSVFLRAKLGDYPKALRIYPDELRYVSIARSLFQGQGLQIHNLNTDFQKILYSICIMPAFLAKASDVQIRLIGYINSVIISSSIFPVYALCRKMFLKERETSIILAFWATLPTLLNSMYFMSEVLYLPLSLWLIYCVWCTYNSINFCDKLRWNLLLGVLCYLAYLCKEIALYFILAFFLTCIIRLLIQRTQWKRELVCFAVFVGTFIFCFLVMKITLFYGMHNSYSSSNLSGIRRLALLQHPEKLCYLLYAFVYNVLNAIIAMGVFPVLIPFFFFDKKKQESWLYLFLLMAFIIGCATIAYTITLPEEYGKRSPRQLLRYLEPFAIPFYIMMIYHLKTIDSNTRRIKIGQIVIYLFSVTYILIGKGGGSCLVDNTMLVYYEFFVRFIGKADWISFIVRTAMGIVLVFGTWILLKDRQQFIKLFAILFICINLVNSIVGYVASIYRYAITEEQRIQASQANEYLQNIEGTILLISDDGYESEDSRLFDTYINRNFYVTEIDLIRNSEIDLSTEKIPCYFPNEFYRQLIEIDYLIVKEDYGIHFQADTVQEVKGFPMKGYQLYKNKNTDRIIFQ